MAARRLATNPGPLIAAVLWLFSPCVTYSQGPVATWPFGGNANDLSGNGHHGAVNGATLIDDRFGNPNSAYAFDGMTSDITVAGHADFRFGEGQAFTISAWFKFCVPQAVTPRTGNPDDWNAPAIIGTYLPTPFPPTGWNLFIYSFQGESQQNVPSFFGTGNWRFSTMTVNDGRWHHLVVTLERDHFNQSRQLWAMAARAYLDGSEVSFAPSPPLGYHDFSTNTSPLIIGRGQGILPSVFNGAIDDLSIYHRALSRDEVASVYRANGWPGTGSIAITPSGSPRICAGDSIRLDVRGTPPITFYRWSPETGLSDSRVRNPIARPATTTTYRVQGFSGGPCSQFVAAAEITIEVDPAPSMHLNRSTRYVCKASAIVLGSRVKTGLAPFTVSWSPATDLDNPLAEEPRLTVTRTERYIATIVDARGCVGRDTIVVTALTPPTAVAGRDTLHCAGDAGIALGTADEIRGGNMPYRFAWSPAAGLDDSTLKRPIARPDTTTRYIVSVTDAFGCIGYDTVVVDAAPKPVAAAGDDAEVCAGGGVVIGSTALAGHRYRWHPADGLSDPTVAMPFATPVATTTYALIVTNAAGCEARDTVRVSTLEPAVDVSTSALDFGSLDGCTSSSELELTLSSSGTSDFRITSAVLATSDFVALTPLPIELQAGASRMFRVRFAPTAAGAARDTLVLRGEPCGIIARIALAGHREASLMSASVAAIDFGSHPVCARLDSVIELTFSNDGDAPARLLAALVDAPFSIEPGQLPADLPGGSTLTVGVRYRPVAPGVDRSELRVPFESGTCRDTLRVRIEGTLDLPELTTPDLIDFGTIDGCVSFRDTVVELRNDESYPLRVESMMLPPGFIAQTSPVGAIPPGGGASFVLRYAPLANGPAGGTLVLRYAPCDLEHRIRLVASKRGVTLGVADSIDFGNVVHCAVGTPNVVRAFTLSFSGATGTTAAVRSVSVTGPFTTDLVAGTTVPNGEARPFTVTFAPPADGVATGAIDLVLDPCGIARRIELRGERTSIALRASDLDFGMQALSTVSSREIAVVNVGAAALRIDSVGEVARPFRITGTRPALPATIGGGDSLVVRVEYDPLSGASSDSVRVFVAAPCVTTHAIAMRGAGTSTGEATIRLPRIVASAGDRLRFALVIDTASGLDAAGARGFEAVIAFDRTLLVPLDDRGVSADAVTRRVGVNGARGESDTLARFEMIATLGMRESTPLVIESFRWTDATLAVETTLVDGELRIDGICPGGGVRLFDGSGVVLLKPPAPNPTATTASLEFELSESGRTRLLLYDAFGRLAVTLVDGELTAGVYAHWLDIEPLAAGSYLLVLRTPTIVLSENITVQK